MGGGPGGGALVTGDPGGEKTLNVVWRDWSSDGGKRQRGKGVALASRSVLFLSAHGGRGIKSASAVLISYDLLV